MKKLIASLLIICFIFSLSLSVFAAQDDEILYGDADGNGVVTILDVTRIQRHLVFSIP